MLKKNLMMVGFLILISGLISFSYAADSQVLTPKAVIPPASALSVKVFKIVGDTWTDASSIDFSSLVFNSKYGIFTSACYYAVDVVVNSNAADWQVKHETTAIANGSETLDENINVTFANKKTADWNLELLKVNFAESNGKVFSKNTLAGGQLRIYYGLATGDKAVDAPNATPVVASKNFGNYKGTVKITLTEN